MFAQNNCTIVEFLGKAVEPPTLRVSRDAVQLLKTIDALNAWEDLTPLGVCLLNLSTDPRYGKILLYAVILKCLDPVLTIVASLDGRDPFIIPTRDMDRRRMNMVRKKLAEGTSSDHFVLLRAYQVIFFQTFPDLIINFLIPRDGNKQFRLERIAHIVRKIFYHPLQWR